MENNKSEFKRTGVMHCGAELLEIQINQEMRLVTAQRLKWWSETIS